MNPQMGGDVAIEAAIGTASDDSFGPWNPGILSEIPDAIRHLSTFLRPENAFTTIAAARELRDFTGLELADIVALRPERLALHELLIRVTADLSVPDGVRIEDLGINFRQITRTILAKHVQPRMAEVDAEYARVRRELSTLIDRELARLFAPPTTSTRKRSPFAFLTRRRGGHDLHDSSPNRDARIAADWDAKAQGAADPLQAAAYRALARVLSALLVRHGRAWGSREMVARLAVDLACNDAASDAIGRLIEPWLAEAVRAEGYRRLPRQAQPVVMNTKGASASGKSTLRPLQRALASRIGVEWSEFALISPDIWRKQLLDYGSLGPHYKYAGAFTGEELKIVDQKLDRYMARKGARGEMPHLLIDRFRFDSFAPYSDEAGSNLLTRFGQILYLFFMITPPASLVERAWKRGLDVGRYKAVDDTLAHGVEAYSGMPELFFTWVARRDKRMHFEFLDNRVRLPERPRTVAFGWNDAMNVFDVGSLLDVERYRRVDIAAKDPQTLYADPRVLAPAANTAFLHDCLERFEQVNFAEQASGRVYLHVAHGAAVWADRDALARALRDDDTREALAHVLPAALREPLPAPARATFVAGMTDGEPIATLGEWGWDGDEMVGDDYRERESRL
ncbi:MAG TPA: hypothetical protein VL654_00455 [Casimicrobiaceae bacterium]|jgi:hypothetical protein|nr:hypothetical protein [Casimicrobiaceae bacterium]